MTELHELSALDQWLALQRGEFSPRDLVDHYLERIERLNPDLGAFVTVTADAAIRRAENLESVVSRTSPLWGLPTADKDLTQRRGVQTGFGSQAFTGTISHRSDEIVEVLDDAGAISLGKTNTPEFGMYGYTESRVAPPARNPWDLSLGAGGSSGGAAAAVSARLLPFAPGSDGGGSIRIPAAACGLVGIKPSRGLVPAGSGIDSVGGLAVKGPIARSVADAALLLDAMIARRNGRIDHHFTLRAPDDNDGDLLGAAVRGEGRFNIGVLRNSPFDDARDIVIAPEASAALDIALAQLSSIGHGMEEVALSHGGVYADAFRRLWQISAATIPVADDSLELLEPVTAELVRGGRQLGAREVMETLSIMSGFERSVIAQFSQFDAVISPALGQLPRPVGSYDLENPDENFWQQVEYSPFTSFVNVAGLPAITLPISETSEGLPMGVQLIGRPGGEATLLSIGAQLERRIRWQHRSPAIASR
ncbi:amidase [Mycetocola zhujimingii]|uniref:Amidase n=1 Tax=Mycetocola zhujimingii TaxID=2079792 RepID=A0A2U1TEX0_9MICO|nr:amidase [Mycetocola zhujimingii]PWC07360.1 amidase [Mycetocola zhujimingii]